MLCFWLLRGSAKKTTATIIVMIMAQSQKEACSKC